jgi:acyl-[acyl-carrier-protein]-phospholipid O-acyltransferase/long-chain-fatty-acid--[acyl-carrier-protein] ligase
LAGLTTSWIFFRLGVLTLGAVGFVLKTWGKEGVRDFGAILKRV